MSQSLQNTNTKLRLLNGFVFLQVTRCTNPCLNKLPFSINSRFRDTILAAKFGKLAKKP